MSRRLTLCLLITGLGCTPPPAPVPDAAPADAAQPAPVLRFPQGKALDQAALSALPRAGTVRARIPNAEAPATWRGAPLADVLDAALGDAWRGADELLLTCLDGYQPTYPVARVLAHQPWLVWGRDDGPFAHAFPSQTKPSPLGPWFLVWSTPDAKLGWAYQITTFETVRFAERFAPLLPAADAPEAVQRGFAVWRAQCTKCHRLNGAGGTIGPELNQPVSVTTYWREDWLRRWIRAPQSIRVGTTMPPVALSDAALDDLLAYLKAMAPKPTRP